MKEPSPKTAAPRKSKKLVSRRALLKVTLAAFILLLIGSSATVLYFYNYHSRIIERRLGGEVFKSTARIYAAPYFIRSAIAPMISAGVMIANIIWNMAKTFCDTQ